MGLWTPIGNKVENANLANVTNGVQWLPYRHDFDTTIKLEPFDMVLLRVMIDTIAVDANFGQIKDQGLVVDPEDNWVPAALWPPQKANAMLVATAYTSLTDLANPFDPYAIVKGGLKETPNVKNQAWPPDLAEPAQPGPSPGIFSVPRRAELGSAVFVPPLDLNALNYPVDDSIINSLGPGINAVNGVNSKWMANIQGTLNGYGPDVANPFLYNTAGPYNIAGYPPLGTLRFSISCISLWNHEEIPFRPVHCRWAVWGWKQ